MSDQEQEEQKIITIPALPPDLHLPFQVPLRDYVKAHHSLYEYWMRRLSGNGYKTFCWAVRCIIGWVDENTGQPRADEVAISLDEFMEQTGISNRRVMVAAIQECLQEGALIAGEKRGAHGAKYYGLRRDPRSYTYAIPKKKKRSSGESATTESEGAHRPVADVPPIEMADMPLVEVTDVPLDAMADMPPDKQRPTVSQAKQQEPPDESKHGAKETLKEELKKQERKKPVDLEPEEKTTEDALSPSAPADATNRDEQARQRQEAAARRAAELTEAKRQRIERIQQITAEQIARIDQQLVLQRQMKRLAQDGEEWCKLQAEWVELGEEIKEAEKEKKRLEVEAG